MTSPVAFLEAVELISFVAKEAEAKPLSHSITHSMCTPNISMPSTEKRSTARGRPEYVGVWAAPTPPHIPLLALRGWFFQWTHSRNPNEGIIIVARQRSKGYNPSC